MCKYNSLWVRSDIFCSGKGCNLENVSHLLSIQGIEGIAPELAQRQENRDLLLSRGGLHSDVDNKSRSNSTSWRAFRGMQLQEVLLKIIYC